jgi:hypothetical protein
MLFRLWQHGALHSRHQSNIRIIFLLMDQTASQDSSEDEVFKKDNLSNSQVASRKLTTDASAASATAPTPNKTFDTSGIVTSPGPVSLNALMAGTSRSSQQQLLHPNLHLGHVSKKHVITKTQPKNLDLDLKEEDDDKAASGQVSVIPVNNPPISGEDMVTSDGRHKQTPKNNILWQYFNMSAKKKRSNKKSTLMHADAICQIHVGTRLRSSTCGAVLGRSDGSTSGMRHHLKAVHPQTYLALKQGPIL